MAASVNRTRLVPHQVFSAGFKSDTGAVNMAVNGSSTPQKFGFGVSSGSRPFFMQSVGMTLSGASFAPENFGGIGDGLANGILIEILNPNDVPVMRLHDGPIRTNADLFRWAGRNIALHQTVPPTLRADWVIPDIFGSDIVLEPSQRLQATVRDDLSSLSGLYLTMTGAYTRND